MEYEQSDLLKWLRNRAFLEESDVTTWQLNLAADTIERLQKEVERFREEREARNFMSGIQWSEEDQERMSKLDAEPLKLNRIRPPASD